MYKTIRIPLNKTRSYKDIEKTSKSSDTVTEYAHKESRKITPLSILHCQR